MIQKQTTKELLGESVRDLAAQRSLDKITVKEMFLLHPALPGIPMFSADRLSFLPACEILSSSRLYTLLISTEAFLSRFYGLHEIMKLERKAKNGVNGMLNRKQKWLITACCALSVLLAAVISAHCHSRAVNCIAACVMILALIVFGNAVMDSFFWDE